MSVSTIRSTFGRALLCVLVVLGISLVTVGCSVKAGGDDSSAADGEKSSDKKDKKDKKDGEEAEEDKEEAVPVQLASLGRGQIEAVLRFSTNLEAEKEVQVLAEAAREIKQLLVEEGDRVRRGQVLIRLEDEEQRTEVSRIESQLGKAHKELLRRENLFKQELISEQEFNDANYDVEQLELAIHDAKRQLSYTEVKAPISGTVTQRLVKVGDHISINQHLFDIIDFNSIVARVYVPEKELVRLKKGQVARITAQALGNEARFGAIDRIAPIVDSRSGTVKVTVAMPASEGLRPGMYVSVDLVTETHDEALLVPKRALVYDDDQIFVFRMAEEGRVERLMIAAVLEDQDNIEPAGVLEEGDRIIIAGQAGLKNGSLVRDVEAPAEETSVAEEAVQGDEPASD
jgi:membrane fusion protein (multidrug efflux system)